MNSGALKVKLKSALWLPNLKGDMGPLILLLKVSDLVDSDFGTFGALGRAHIKHLD